MACNIQEGARLYCLVVAVIDFAVVTVVDVFVVVVVVVDVVVDVGWHVATMMYQDSSAW